MTSAVTSVNLGTKVLLSVEETATLRGETRSTLYQAIKTGTVLLPVFQICGCRRIPRRAVERLTEGLGDFGEESTDGAGALDRRLRGLEDLHIRGVSCHLRRMAETAWRHGTRPGLPRLRAERQAWHREAARWRERIGSRWSAPAARALPNTNRVVADGANRAGRERRL